MRLFKQKRNVITCGYTALFIALNPSFSGHAENSYLMPNDISSQRLTDSQQVAGYNEEIINSQTRISGPLDIKKAVKNAVNWHPAITQEVSKLQEMAQKVDVAKAKYYPQISAGMNNGYSNTYSDAGYTPSLVVSVSQMLYDFGKVSSSVRAADSGVAQQQATVMLNIDQVAHDTAAAVVQVQGYQKLVDIAKAQVNSLKQIGDLIRQRNDAGASSLSDVVQTDTRVEGAQSTLLQYQAALQRWKATLATYIGIGGIATVTDDLPQGMDAACAVSKIDYRSVPAVLAALAQAGQAQAQLDNANAQMLPTISLEPEVTHYLNDNYANSAVLNKTQYSAWVKVQMPIYQGGAMTASRDAAQQSLAAVFAFVLKIMRGHVTDLLGKRGDIRVSDRVFGHALRLKNSAVPRSTGSFISQIRELEQVREMMTSTMMTIVADLPFFLLFQVVLFIVSPWLSWIAPVATILMILPGLLLQRKLAALANKNQHENTLRNAILVESIQGLQDIKMMQAESRFLHQWNSYIAITAESGVKTRRLTHGLVSWGMSVQNLLYATVVVVGAPLVINGDITTGAMVAASMLSTRMVAPMTALCGVLARWQQVKTAKASLDNLMALPVEGGQDETRVHRAVLHGNYEFRQAEFRYGLNDAAIPLRINQLSIKAGERIAILGRIGAGKSTLLQAMMGNVELVSGELRLDDLSLPQIDLADIRRNATLLTQEARLFHGTLRENLILGRPAATDDEIFSVLTLCGALEFVRKLPLGLEHVVMEGGLGLSGGQRQSLLLARTLLRDPNIILLDEPTSFFDERTEKAFVEQLAQWAGERTMIIATHKAAVLNIVDRILVIQDGQLALDKPKATVFEQEKARGQVVNI